MLHIFIKLMYFLIKKLVSAEQELNNCIIEIKNTNENIFILMS